MNKLTEQTWIPIGGAIAVISVMVACTWALQGRLTKIEGAVEVIPKIESKLERVSEEVASQKGDFKVIKLQVDNIQANSKVVIQKLNKQASAVAGALNRDQFGSAN